MCLTRASLTLDPSPGGVEAGFREAQASRRRNDARLPARGSGKESPSPSGRGVGGEGGVSRGMPRADRTAAACEPLRAPQVRDRRLAIDVLSRP